MIISRKKEKTPPPGVLCKKICSDFVNNLSYLVILSQKYTLFIPLPK